jgi:hypothetical protein
VVEGVFAPLTGSAGRPHSPQAGAFTRLAESVDFVRLVVALEEDVSTVPVEVVEVTEPLLSSSNDDLFLLGNGGGCFLIGSVGGADGRLPFLESLIEPLTCSEGMLIVCCFVTAGRLLGIEGVG